MGFPSFLAITSDQQPRAREPIITEPAHRLARLFGKAPQLIAPAPRGFCVRGLRFRLSEQITRPPTTIADRSSPRTPISAVFHAGNFGAVARKHVDPQPNDPSAGQMGRPRKNDSLARKQVNGRDIPALTVLSRISA